MEPATELADEQDQKQVDVTDTPTAGTPDVGPAPGRLATAGLRQERRRRATQVLSVIDIVSAVAALTAMHYILPSVFPFDTDVERWFPGLYILLVLLSLGKLGSYSLSTISSGWQHAARVILSHHTAAAWLWLLQLLIQRAVENPAYWLILATIGWTVNLSLRMSLHLTRMRDAFTEQALVLHSSEDAEQVRQLLDELEKKKPRVRVVAVKEPADLTVGGAPAPVGALLDVVRKAEADTVVVGMTKGFDDRTYVALSLCSEEGVRVVRVPEYFEEWVEMVPLEYVNNAWRLYGFTHQVDPYYSAVHRMIDLVVAALGLVLLAVVFLPTAIAIKLTSRGPVIYTSDDPTMMRVGLGGRLFKIYKFRTMTEEAALAVSRQKEDEDPRVTRIGRLLRRMKLDELPQMWNVLLGQMSVVGPRPICASEDEEMIEQVPLYHLRRLVRPGLTGLGQVAYGTAKLPEEHMTRLQYDLYYIKHRCFALDMEILAKTLLVCVGLRQR